ncbi:Methane oxygenase PmoA [Maribacter sedimenticola]|uniref:Methane oxygenase PmoA n=1 Tax=Maribacter sedimenticola TaxID=228956 RepID=A0ABY1SEV9_9FLAO|nr:PmoA family protein [Maribacter sedimenticola]SNR31446.1 Methane oxygenase PmoA [Maribacter sedimenticola]
MKNIFLIVFVVFLISCQENKKDYNFYLQEGSGLLINTPVSLELEELKDENVSLLNGDDIIPFDLDTVANKIWFIHQKNRTDEYQILVNNKPVHTAQKFSAVKNEGDLMLQNSSNALVGYRYGMHYPPKGVDTIFKKSGFIHPIITPKGDTLTRINPPDHWHHYGVWGPWTHTRIDTMRVDFWNLGDGQGTVLFKEFNEISNGAVSTGFNAVQEHIDYKTQTEPQVALNENLQIRLWDLGREDRYMLDYTSSFTTPLAEGILFEAYRYGGGLGMRFTERWHKDNCKVLTSEGEDRLTADGTNAKWAIVTGESSDGKGTNGILFLSNPNNRMHPEPMRVWPIDGNGGRGDMFFEFCPIRHVEWQIEPNKEYELKYRMIVFDGELYKEEAEAYWQSFANPLELKPIAN